MKKIKREAYADMYGPTTGDKIRLADTELFIDCLLYTSDAADE